jgi:O-acetylserine/cysteine efflux transporter
MAKPATAHFPAMFSMGVGYLVCFLLISLIWRAPRKTAHHHVALIAFFAVTLQGYLCFTAYRDLTAGVANIVVQVQVPFGVLMGWLLLGERLDGRKIIGMLIAFIGIAVVVGLPQEPPPLLPVLLMASGAMAWALGQVFSRLYGKDEGIILLRSIAMHALPQLALLSILLESGHWQSIATATSFEWFAFGIFAFFGFFCAYALWYTVLARNRIDEAIPFTMLMPVVGVLVALLVLRETVSVASLVGGAICMSGVAIVSGLDQQLARVFSRRRAAGA